MSRLDDLRTELIQGLAKALANTGGSRVQWSEAQAAAQSVVDGKGLPETVASRFGSSPVCTLVSFDADHIQRWVFASERVQVAKGASLTLERINSRLKEKDPGIDGITGVAYSAGGGGMLFAIGIEQGEELETAVRRSLEKDSHELTFTVTSLPLCARDLAPGNPPHPLSRGGAAVASLKARS